MSELKGCIYILYRMRSCSYAYCITQIILNRGNSSSIVVVYIIYHATAVQRYVVYSHSTVAGGLEVIS